MVKLIRTCTAAAYACFLLNGAAALAHAFPEKTEPRVGAAAVGSTREVRIWFDAEIEPVFSTLRVVDAQGRQVSQGPGSVDPENGRLLAVGVPPLAPGAYRVFWRVVARDGHTTEGDYPFTVGR